MCCLRNFSGTATLIKERLATQKIKTMQTKTSPLKITPLHAFDDNYIWCIETQESDHFVVVDPGDASVVTSYALKIQKKLSAILVTHHHGDHTGGVAELTAHYSDIPVYGPENSPYQGITHTLKEDCNVNILGVNFNVMEIPGHTLDHIAYFNHQQEILFCGDTLFLAGCGRVFEGTPKQMHHSLSKIMELPPTTRAYPTHVYSLANLAALVVLPVPLTPRTIMTVGDEAPLTKLCLRGSSVIRYFFISFKKSSFLNFFIIFLIFSTVSKPISANSNFSSICSMFSLDILLPDKPLKALDIDDRVFSKAPNKRLSILSP